MINTSIISYERQFIYKCNLDWILSDDDTLTLYYEQRKRQIEQKRESERLSKRAQETKNHYITYQLTYTYVNNCTQNTKQKSG